MSKAAAIMKNVCKAYGVMPNELRGQSRESNLVNARATFAFLCRKQGWSTPMIGRLLRRAHSTILHYLKKYQQNQGKTQ